jgi:hypothetical protein
MGCAFAMFGNGCQRQAGHPEIHHPAQAEAADRRAEQQELIVHAAGRNEFLASVMTVVIAVSVSVTMVMGVIVRASTMFVIV